MKRFLKITGTVLLLVLLAAAAGIWILFGSRIRAAGSIQKLGDDLWAMEYAGDYGFDTFIEQGGAASDADMGSYIESFLTKGLAQAEISPESGRYGCSTLTVRSAEGSLLFGRNLDWAECSAMIVHAKPKNGYESVSTSCLEFLDFGEGWEPDKDFGSRIMALAAVYVPLDGMNEKGLCVADLMVEPGEVFHQRTDKPDLTVVSAIRLLLDRAATVDEALELLGRYDMNSSMESAHHLAIADMSGKSVVVEYLNNEMVVTDTNVVTNHYVTQGEDLPEGAIASYKRFETLAELSEQNSGEMTMEQLRDAMAKAASTKFNKYRTDHVRRVTQWTIVCDPAAGREILYANEKYDEPFAVTLGQKKWLSFESYD